MGEYLAREKDDEHMWLMWDSTKLTGWWLVKEPFDPSSEIPSGIHSFRGNDSWYTSLDEVVDLGDNIILPLCVYLNEDYL